MKKCGDCIHADICKEVNGGWFSPNNPAYCKGFKDRTNYVEVVRCKDCKNAVNHPFMADSQKVVCTKSVNFRAVESGHYCSYGERRTDV